MKYFTVGAILRQGLLKNHQGKPYKDKATILKRLHKLPVLKKRTTPFGEGYAITQSQITYLNRLWE